MKMPGLFQLNTKDSHLNSWAQLVNEHLEVWKGSRGDKLDRVATQRDLTAATTTISSATPEVTTKAVLPVVQQATPDALLSAQIATISARLDALARGDSAKTAQMDSLVASDALLLALISALDTRVSAIEVKLTAHGW